MRRYSYDTIHADGSKYHNIPLPQVNLTPERQRMLQHAQDTLLNNTIYELELRFNQGQCTWAGKREYTVRNIHPTITADTQDMGYYLTFIYAIEVDKSYKYYKECKDLRWHEIPDEVYLQQQQMDTLLHGDLLITKESDSLRTAIARAFDTLSHWAYNFIEPINHE